MTTSTSVAPKSCRARDDNLGPAIVKPNFNVERCVYERVRAFTRFSVNFKSELPVRLGIGYLERPFPSPNGVWRINGGCLRVNWSTALYPTDAQAA